MGHVSSKTVKIRKEQSCWGCARHFQPGTKMTLVKWADDGIHNIHWCRTCEEYYHEYMDGEEIQQGELLDTDDYSYWIEIQRKFEEDPVQQLMYGYNIKQRHADIIEYIRGRLYGPRDDMKIVRTIVKSIRIKIRQKSK